MQIPIQITFLILALALSGCVSVAPTRAVAPRDVSRQPLRTGDEPAWLTGTIEPEETTDTSRLPETRNSSDESETELGKSAFSKSLRGPVLSWLDNVESDHRAFYSRDSLWKLGAGTLVSGVLANTSLDKDINDHFQTSVAGAPSDDWFESLHAPKPLGNGTVTLPLFALAWGAGSLFDDTLAGSRAAEWGERSLRTFVVGAPPLLVMQHLTGGSRPGESSHTSSWRPFQDDNGASGHAFMGALPFLSAAKMTDDPWLKLALYGGSTVTGLSRVNDGAHYTSQALLGWWIALLAAEAVDQTQETSRNWSLVPFPDPHTAGAGVLFKY